MSNQIELGHTLSGRWLLASEHDASANLKGLANALNQCRIPHKFTLEGGVQRLWVLDQAHIAEARQLAANPEIYSTCTPSDPEESARVQVFMSQKPAPLTLVVLFLALVGSALVGIDATYAFPFTFYDQVPFYRDLGPFADIINGDVWRLLTPIFLHFSLLHIVFNGLWWWFLGSRVERRQGAIRLLLVVLFCALVSNMAQALVSYPQHFGGLSGVVMGMFSYVWASWKMTRDSELSLPPALFPIMTLFMLASAFGLFNWMAPGDSEIADTAHISGYLAGFVAAFINAGIRQITSHKN